MRSILLTCFDETNVEYYDQLSSLVATHDYYIKEHKIEVINQNEIDFIKFLLVSYENSKTFPSQELFLSNFDFLSKDTFANIPKRSLKDYRVYINNFVYKRVNDKISKLILELNTQIKDGGFSEDLMSELSRLHKISVINKKQEVSIDFDFRAVYNEKLNTPIGMIFNIDVIDSKIGGLDKGSLNTIAGFTSHFKSTMALNLAYYNTYFNGYNTVLVSLETPKEDVYSNLMCRHSFDPKFSEYEFISHQKIKRCELSEAEQSYLFDVVEKDWKDNKRGELIILDETDFESMSTSEITGVFEDIDEKIEGGLDAFIIDYIQLLKFSNMAYHDDNRAINAYVSYFRRLAQKFKNGESKLVGIILSQINRESWKRASKNEGRYDVTCLADANELERGSYRVFTVYTTETMKASKEASIQILKNRNGPNLYDPEVLYADGENYVFGDLDDLFSSPNIMSGSGSDSLGDMMDGLDF